MPSLLLPVHKPGDCCARQRACTDRVRFPRVSPRCTQYGRLACRAAQSQQTEPQSVWPQDWKTRLAATAAAAALAFGSAAPAALASEFDLLAEPTPTSNYVLDDASVLNRSSRKGLNETLQKLEEESGYRLEAVTVRKLETESDAFAFGDKLIEKWYKSVDKGTNKGVLVVVTTGKDGALTGGPKFLKAVGDQLIDSIASENIPILTSEEKYNETVSSSVDRVVAVIKGQTDPGPPQRGSGERKRTFRTKRETAKAKNITGPVVGALLLIAFVVPMVQYWGYTRKG